MIKDYMKLQENTIEIFNRLLEIKLYPMKRFLNILNSQDTVEDISGSDRLVTLD